MVAQGWLVYALTGSPFYLGVVALARAIPVFVFSLIGGAVADRADRRLVIAVANGTVRVLAGFLVAVFGTFPRRGLVIALSGVVFGISLCVFAFSTSMLISVLAVMGARLGLGLPYFSARGRPRQRGDMIDYGIQRRSPTAPTFAARYRIDAPTGPARPGRLDHFLLERYVLHVDRRIGLWTVQVHHRPYPVHGVHVLEVSDQLASADGLRLPRQPALAHCATQVDIDVFAPQRIDGVPESDQERRHASPVANR
jgi:uncharacterized protein YqjF (DUF2071 family)